MKLYAIALLWLTLSIGNNRSPSRIILTPRKGDASTVRFAVTPNYTCTLFVKLHKKNVSILRLGQNETEEICFSSSEFRDGFLFMELYDHTGKRYACTVRYHDSVESVSDGNHRIYTSYYFESEDLILPEQTASCMEFSGFSPIIESKYSLSLYAFCTPLLMETPVPEAMLVLHLPPETFAFLPYSSSARGYAFPLTIRLEGQRAVLQFPEPLYYQIGTLEPSGEPGENFLKTDRIYFPLAKKIVSCEATVLYRFPDYRVLCSQELIFDKTAVEDRYWIDVV